MLDTILQVETPEGVDLDLVVAGPAVRFLAWLIDFVLRFVIAFNLAVPLAIFGDLGGGLLLIILFILEWFYPVLFEVYSNGSTPGKKIFGLRVLHLDGTPVDWGPSVVRNLMRAADFLPIIYGFGLVSMLFNRRFQRLGDLAAGTIVVYGNRGFGTYVTIPDYPPIPPPLPLKLDEQRAIIRFAQRMSILSTKRVQELASIVAEPLLKNRNDNRSDPAVFLCGMAKWLHGDSNHYRSGDAE